MMVNKYVKPVADPKTTNCLVSKNGLNAAVLTIDATAKYKARRTAIYGISQILSFRVIRRYVSYGRKTIPNEFWEKATKPETKPSRMSI
jgi:hypothetical protein